MQVPPKLRAALFDLVGAFATEPASAAKIWCAVRVRHPVGSVCVTRSARACRAYLEKAAVVQKPADAGTGFFGGVDVHMQSTALAGPRTDILYEARACMPFSLVHCMPAGR